MDVIIQGHFFEKNEDIRRTRRCLLYLLEALVQMDWEWLKHHPSTPLLYESGVEYISDPFNVDHPAQELQMMQELSPGAPQRDRKLELWSMIPNIIEQGGSDCKNLAAWRCAELRKRNIPCRPYMKWKRVPQGYTLYHVLVEYRNPDTGRYPFPGERVDEELMEDPSKILGMGRNGR